MPKPIRFLLLVILLTLLALTVWWLIYGANPIEEYRKMLSGGITVAQRVAEVFQFADDWNIVAIVFLFSISVIVFCGNDLLLQRYIPLIFSASSDELIKGGILWASRMCINGVLFILQTVLLCYLINASFSSPRIYAPEEITTGQHTVLLLGTSKYLRGTNTLNTYYTERIEAVVKLFKNGVVKRVVISGDGASTKDYDETRDMAEDLRKKGVSSPVILDKKGFRTFDSIKRLRANTDGSGVIIVSQHFHLERALYLADAEYVDAIGAAAEGSATLQMFEREMFAKAKVLLDVYIFNTQTKGIAYRPRREIKISNVVDISLMIFVLAIVLVSGRMSRQLLLY